MEKKNGYCRRPRFGWADDLGLDPQLIREDKVPEFAERPVAVIPLPFISPKKKSQIRKFVKELWSGIDK